MSRKSEEAVAIRYAFSHWRVLMHYSDDGRFEIDNNDAEPPELVIHANLTLKDQKLMRAASFSK